MQFTVRDAAEILSVSEATIYRWMKSGELKARRIGHQIRLNREALLEYARARGLMIPTAVVPVGSANGAEPFSVAVALAAGGIHCDVEGSDVAAVLRAAVSRLDLPTSIDRTNLCHFLLAREALASTGVGDGIALPHVRNPIVLHGTKPAIALCFLANPVDFAAQDGVPVRILFLLLSPTVPVHLHLLSRLSFVLRDPTFRAALSNLGSAAEIINAARQAEAVIGNSAHDDHGQG